MSLATLSSAVAASRREIEQSTREMNNYSASLERMRDRVRGLSRQRAADDLDAIVDHPLGGPYLELLAIDANHPELVLHERIIGRFLKINSGVFLQLRKLFADAQRRKSRDQSANTPFRGALDAGETQAILDSIRGIDR